MQKHSTLGEFIIENQMDFKYSSGELSRLMNSIRLASKVVNHEVNKAGLVDILGGYLNSLPVWDLSRSLWILLIGSDVL